MLALSELLGLDDDVAGRLLGCEVDFHCDVVFGVFDVDPLKH